jgi:hypothetical protein
MGMYLSDTSRSNVTKYTNSSADEIQRKISHQISILDSLRELLECPLLLLYKIMFVTGKSEYRGNFILPQWKKVA